MSIIIIKNSTTSSNTPSPGTLVTGELAINVVDGKLFYGSGSAVREFSSTINTGSLLTTASFNSYTSSTTAQFAGTASYASQSLSASYATTASYAMNAGASIDTSSFATTGSNTFIGNQTITGSLTTTSTINGASATEIGYLSGVTSSIQTQINGKQTDSAWVEASGSAISGWSATTVKLIQYKLLGSKTMIFQFRILGTGSGTAASMILPFTSSAWGTQTNMYRALNSTTQNTGAAQVAVSSTALTFYPSSNPAAAWTDATARQVEGTITINLLP